MAARRELQRGFQKLELVLHVALGPVLRPEIERVFCEGMNAQLGGRNREGPLGEGAAAPVGAPVGMHAEGTHLGERELRIGAREISKTHVDKAFDHGFLNGAWSLFKNEGVPIWQLGREEGGKKMAGKNFE